MVPLPHWCHIFFNKFVAYLYLIFAPHKAQHCCCCWLLLLFIMAQEVYSGEILKSWSFVNSSAYSYCTKCCCLSELVKLSIVHIHIIIIIKTILSFVYLPQCCGWSTVRSHSEYVLIRLPLYHLSARQPASQPSAQPQSTCSQLE